MSKSFPRGGWRGLLALVLLGGMLSVPGTAGAAAKPYVESEAPRGFHLFLRPRMKAPDAQWKYVQDLDRDGKTRAAAKQALALRIWWPDSPEAPQAQMLHARLLDRRGHLEEAFDAYQHLVEQYPGRFEFNAVLERQLQIAKTLMAQKKGRFFIFPGFDAPARAIPLFEKIIASAPEWHGTAEAFYLTGVANERIYEYDLAIDAYFNALNRFPDSAFAEKAAYAQTQCHIQISEDSPNDSRALDTARAACILFLQRFPDSDRRAGIEADLARIRGRQAGNALARARYYDRILKKPAAALIEYQSFVALFPDDERVSEARARIAQLKPNPEN